MLLRCWGSSFAPAKLEFAQLPWSCCWGICRSQNTSEDLGRPCCGGAAQQKASGNWINWDLPTENAWKTAGGAGMLLVRGVFVRSVWSHITNARKSLLGMFSPWSSPKQGLQGGVWLCHQLRVTMSPRVPVPWGHSKVTPWQQIPGRFCSGIGACRETGMVTGTGQVRSCGVLGAVQCDRSWELGTKCDPGAMTETQRKRK